MGPEALRGEVVSTREAVARVPTTEITSSPLRPHPSNLQVLGGGEGEQLLRLRLSQIPLTRCNPCEGTSGSGVFPVATPPS